MGLLKNLDERAKRLGLVEIILLQVATACLVVLIIKFAPSIIIIRKEWFISVFLISLIRPLYVFLKKND